MTVRVSGSDFVEFESPRSSVVSIESGIELSQVSFQSSPRQHSPNYPARNSSPFHPCIAPHVSSRIILFARNENSTMSASSVTENSNPDSGRQFSNIISKLARHPWTESTEFVELWSDIPGKIVDQSKTDHEQMISHNCTSVSNAVADSNHESSRISWVLSKYPWTASKEFVELWTDIPNDFDVNRNLGKDREDLVQHHFDSSSSNAVELSKDVNDNKQCQYVNPGIFRNSYLESDKFTEASSIAPNDLISNETYWTNLEHSNVSCCKLSSEYLPEIQKFLLCFRNHIFGLVMKILLSLIPLSAFFMGAIHFGTCPANEGVTTLVYMTGIAGIFLIICYIAHYFANDLKEGIKCATKVFQAITAILLTIEMILFYTMSPSFQNSEKYCDEIFYNYAFYMNIAATGIVFLSVLLQYT